MWQLGKLAILPPVTAPAGQNKVPDAINAGYVFPDYPREKMVNISKVRFP